MPVGPLSLTYPAKATISGSSNTEPQAKTLPDPPGVSWLFSVCVCDGKGIPEQVDAQETPLTIVVLYIAMRLIAS